MDEVKKLQAEIERLRQKVDAYESPGPLRAYYALNKILNDQVDYLKDFQLKSHIGSEVKEDKRFDRSKAIWEGMRELAEDVALLKAASGATGDEAKDVEKGRGSFLDQMATIR